MRTHTYTYRDGRGVVGEQASVEGGDVALRGRLVLLRQRSREGEQVVAADADEEEGTRRAVCSLLGGPPWHP